MPHLAGDQIKLPMALGAGKRSAFQTALRIFDRIRLLREFAVLLDFLGNVPGHQQYAMHSMGNIALRSHSHLEVTNLHGADAAVTISDGLIAAQRAFSGLQIAEQIVRMDLLGCEILGPQRHLTGLAVLAQGFLVDIQQIVLDIPFIDVHACGARSEVEPREKRTLLFGLAL